MAPAAPFPLPRFDGVQLLRPLLEIGRAELRTYLAARGIAWLEDPMNEDPRFARTRIRKALPLLEAAGISTARIAEAAAHLARARAALDGARDMFLAAHVRFETGGGAVLDGDALGTLHRETGLRVLAAVLMRVAGMGYRPRFVRLETLFDAILSRPFAARTLSGCRIGKAPKDRAIFGPSTLIISREPERKAAGKTGKRRAPAPETA